MDESFGGFVLSPFCLEPSLFDFATSRKGGFSEEFFTWMPAKNVQHTLPNTQSDSASASASLWFPILRSPKMQGPSLENRDPKFSTGLLVKQAGKKTFKHETRTITPEQQKLFCATYRLTLHARFEDFS